MDGTVLQLKVRKRRTHSLDLRLTVLVRQTYSAAEVALSLSVPHFHSVGYVFCTAHR
jgi:hypothetical protein